jgi:hypothetical protein
MPRQQMMLGLSGPVGLLSALGIFCRLLVGPHCEDSEVGFVLVGADHIDQVVILSVIAR